MHVHIYSKTMWSNLPISSEGSAGVLALTIPSLWLLFFLPVPGGAELFLLFRKSELKFQIVIYFIRQMRCASPTAQLTEAPLFPVSLCVRACMQQQIKQHAHTHTHTHETCTCFYQNICSMSDLIKHWRMMNNSCCHAIVHKMASESCQFILADHRMRSVHPLLPIPLLYLLWCRLICYTHNHTVFW